MQPFLHDHLQRLERLLESSNDALRSYHGRHPAVAEIAAALLDQASVEYRALGRLESENEMLALKAQLTAAHDGLDPVTLERPAGRRRELARAVVLRVLLRSAESFRSDGASIRRKLHDSREQLLPIVLFALQKGLLPSGVDGIPSQSELEKMWQCLLEDPEAQAAARQVAANVAVADVLLVVGDLLAAMR